MNNMSTTTKVFITCLLMAFSMGKGAIAAAPAEYSALDLRKMAKSDTPVSVEEIKRQAADLGNCIAIFTIPSKVSKVAALNSAELKTVLRGAQIPAGTKYLIVYGFAKKRQTWRALGPMVASATAADFKYLVGTPICLEDPDVDND